MVTELNCAKDKLTTENMGLFVRTRPCLQYMQKKENFKPCDLVIYGALGDLSTRKLLISLYRLEQQGLLEKETQIIGVDLHAKENKEFVKVALDSVTKHNKEDIDKTIWKQFSARLIYVQIDLTKMDQYEKLKAVTDSEKRVLVNYFSVAPFLFQHICQGLDKSGILTEESRVVVEKPLGYDLQSSKDINDAFSAVFHEDQIFRIDHYLGKETVLNLLALRFANSIFTSNWDHNTIDSIQITVAESVGIEGRWQYFDQTGQLRDMVQNHLLQILTFIAMEPPVNLEAKSIRREKIKVLEALRPITASDVAKKTVRGQYSSGFVKGEKVPGYLEEEGANTNSMQESFVALRVDIDNWRWADVPFYLRTGKRMQDKRTEIVINFKRLPHNIFKDSFHEVPANKLVIHLQSKEGIDIQMLNKVPGIDGSIKLQKTKLDLSFSETFKDKKVFGGYERLILEAMRGNPTLFLSREEIEQAWIWIDSIQEAWAHQCEDPKPYPAGSWGPVASVALLALDGRSWEE